MTSVRTSEQAKVIRRLSSDTWRDCTVTGPSGDGALPRPSGAEPRFHTKPIDRWDRAHDNDEACEPRRESSPSSRTFWRRSARALELPLLQLPARERAAAVAVAGGMPASMASIPSIAGQRATKRL